MQINVEQNTIILETKDTIKHMGVKLRKPRSHEYCPSGTQVIQTDNKRGSADVTGGARKNKKNTASTSSIDNTSRNRPAQTKITTSFKLRKKVKFVESQYHSDDDIFQTQPAFNNSSLIDKECLESSNLTLQTSPKKHIKCSSSIGVSSVDSKKNAFGKHHTITAKCFGQYLKSRN